jgi:MFS family permease
VATIVQARSESRRRIGVDADHSHYKWWALSCTSLGMLLATINSGTLIIALPNLERNLHTSLLELVWVILVYMIASTVLVLSAGRLSDQFGRKKAYIGGFLVFAAASLGAGFSGSGTELIIWRLVQGVGGAFLFANSAAIVTDAFPREELGVAMGTNTMVAAIGLVIGPVLGGALVGISWHWVFWFNVPFGLIGVSRGGLEGWGAPTIIALALAVVFLPLFVLVESRHPHPMLDLSIFQNRLFSLASVAAFLNGLARFALTFVFVFYFQGVQGDSPLLAGLKLAPLALGMLIASPIAGVYADRQGSRALASMGMAVTALGLGLMTTLGRDTSYWFPAIFQLIVGLGSGMFNSPNTAAMMGVVAPHRRGIASGARVLVQNTGAVLSIALVLAIVTASVPKSVLFNVFSGLGARISNTQISPFLSNLHLALWILCGVSVIGIFVCFSRPTHACEEPSPADAELVPAA